MAFADLLKRSGYNTRFRPLQVSLQFRDDSVGDIPDGEGEVDPTEGNGDGAGQSKGLTLDGLAVPFDSPTRIYDWFDGEFDEQFRAGSFLETIEQDQQVMLFEHGMHPLFGNLPISEIQSLGETKAGLRVQARMFDNWMTEPLQEPIRAGLMRMSIMFRPKSQEIEERDGDVPLVTVTKAELRELGPVTFPAYPDTWIDLRNIPESARRQLETALRAGAGSPSGGARTPEPINRKRLNLANARLAIMEASVR